MSVNTSGSHVWKLGGSYFKAYMKKQYGFKMDSVSYDVNVVDKYENHLSHVSHYIIVKLLISYHFIII
jgi:hypothetical protein